ncbi:type I-E CRISPR-associated protein Cse1/CasA [Corynebacterium sp. LK2514]|uniref:type I-E CRISPR-associated protein Cse1/CasA n=1 Tax=Corynebacterium sp. LK2514 TaxID=3110473 RepID=UPI0034CFD924
MRVTPNLLDVPWIRCMDMEGNPRVVSVREIFDGRVRVAKIVGESPTQDYAVIRVLLAIFWRAHAQEISEALPTSRRDDSFDWGEWFEETREFLRDSGRDDVVLDYLETYEDRFDLLDDKQPFMQVADLHTKSGGTKSVSMIVPEAASALFTMRTAEERESLSFAEAARWLVHAQAYDYSGIKSGAVGDERVTGGKGYPIGTGWSGQTGGTLILSPYGLLDTLILNTAPEAVNQSATARDLSGDLPVWERPQDSAAQRPGSDPKEGAAPQGAADLATWQARRIRLHVEGGRVRRVVLANGDRIPAAGKNVFGDPMTPYRYSPNQSTQTEDAYYPRPYDETRTMWKSLDALVAVTGDAGFTKKEKAPIRPATLSNLANLSADGYLETRVLDLALVSMVYGPQESSVGTTFSTSIGLPLAVLRTDDTGKRVREAVRTAVEKTRAAAVSVGWFAGQLLVAAGGDYEFGAAAADRLYSRLEPKFIDWLATVDTENVDKRARQWQFAVLEEALDQAVELVRGAGQKAIVGRITDADEKGHGRIVSAGTLHQALRRRLKKDLPLTVPEPEDQNSTEEKDEVHA